MQRNRERAPSVLVGKGEARLAVDTAAALLFGDRSSSPATAAGRSPSLPARSNNTSPGASPYLSKATLAGRPGSPEAASAALRRRLQQLDDEMHELDRAVP